MQKITDLNSGVYILELYAPLPFSIVCKKYTDLIFSKGYYYYAGSAQKNLYHRLKRHIASNKIINWHIDYLTSSIDGKLPPANIKSVYIFLNQKKDFECKIASDLSNNFLCSSDIYGFGNGDCKICSTHLFYKKNRIPQIHFISLYQSTVLRIPASKEIFCL